MATTAPATPQASSTPRLCQSNPVWCANGPSNAWLNGRTGSRPATRRTAYRIVREALTNVRKHAPGARVVVRVEYDPGPMALT